MKRRTIFVLLAILLATSTAACFARTWTDKTGHYKIDADLIAFNDKSVVLQRA